MLACGMGMEAPAVFLGPLHAIEKMLRARSMRSHWTVVGAAADWGGQSVNEARVRDQHPGVLNKERITCCSLASSRPCSLPR